MRLFCFFESDCYYLLAEFTLPQNLTNFQMLDELFQN